MARHSQGLQNNADYGLYMSLDGKSLLVQDCNLSLIRQFLDCTRIKLCTVQRIFSITLDNVRLEG